MPDLRAGGTLAQSMLTKDICQPVSDKESFKHKINKSK